MKGAGYVLGPSIGGAIVWKSNFSMIFLLSFAVGAFAFVLTFLPQAGEKPNLADDEDDFSPKQMVAAFREPELLGWYAVIVVNMFMVGILFGFLPVYVNSLGYDQFRNGMIVTAATTSYLLIQPLAGYLADRFNATRVAVAGLLLSALTVVLLPFTTGAYLVSAAVLGGIGVGSVWTNTDAVVSNLAEESRLGATLGAAGSFKELGDMLGPLLIGFVSQAFSLRVGFVVCGSLGFLALLLIRSGFVPATRIRE